MSTPGHPLFSLFFPDSPLHFHSHVWKMGFFLCPPRKFFWFFISLPALIFEVFTFKLTDSERERKMRAACWNGKNERELVIHSRVIDQRRFWQHREDYSSIPTVFCLLWFRYKFLAFVCSWLGHRGTSHTQEISIGINVWQWDQQLKTELLKWQMKTKNGQDWRSWRVWKVLGQTLNLTCSLTPDGIPVCPLTHDPQICCR